MEHVDCWLHHCWECGCAAAMQCPLQYCNAVLAIAGICNFFRLSVMAHLLFRNDTVGSLMSTSLCWHIGCP